MANLVSLAALLFLVAGTGVVSIDLASSTIAPDSRPLEACLCVLAGAMIALSLQTERLPALVVASPAVGMLGVVHLWLAAGPLPESAATVAVVAGAVEIASALALLPVGLHANAEHPRLSDQLLDAQADAARADEECARLEREFENHRRASDALAGRRLRLAFELDRATEEARQIREAVRPPKDVLVVPADMHPRLRRYLLRMAKDLGWTRIRRFPSGVARAANDRRIGYIDGLEDGRAERRAFWAMETIDGEVPALVSGEMPA